MEFESFQKIPRLSRDITITEKIDGTNAQVCISLEDDGRGDGGGAHWRIRAGSRTRWITPEDDNHGFARWVRENQAELLKLGEGRHFGEWWGSGIQRGYGLTKGDKRFSLFNTHKWSDPTVRPTCCDVVPVLYSGIFDQTAIDEALIGLRVGGSRCSPGFMKPEGIIIYHHAAGLYFKKTLDKDEEYKGKNVEK